MSYREQKLFVPAAYHARAAARFPWLRSASRLTLAVLFAIAVPLRAAEGDGPNARATKVNPKDGLTYVWIAPGKFIMGCSPKDADCFDNEKKVHEVTLTSGLWMGQTDVTQEAYTHVNGRNPSHFKGAKLPVESVNWAEAQNYCQAVGGRLPTEAEWEYAARGGDASARYGQAAEIAWTRDNSGGKTHPVGQKKPNAFGLLDMLGTVWRWTADWYGEYAGAPETDPLGPGGSKGRALRGGSWSDAARFARASAREGAPPEDRYNTIGFRCVTTPAFVPFDRAMLASGGSGSVEIAVPAGSEWSAVSSEAWITFTGSGSGVGSGTLRYQVAANRGARRSAIVTVVNSSFTIEQQAGATAGASFQGSFPDVLGAEDWKTIFTFVNKSSAGAEASLNFLDDTGAPLDLPLTLPDRPAGKGPIRGAGLDRTLAAHASLTIETAGPQTKPLLAGSARVAGTGSLDGFAIFHLFPGDQETVVPLETRDAKAYLLAFDNTGGVALGIAVANLSAQPANVEVVVRDDAGAPIETGMLNLTGNGHTTFAVATQYPSSVNKRGTIELSAPPSGRIAVLGLRTTPFMTPQGMKTMLTTIPALTRVESGSVAEAAAGPIAQVATGNGWETTLVLVNSGPGAARADVSFFDDQGARMPLPLEFPQSTERANTVASSVNGMLGAGAMWVVRSAGPITDPAPMIGSAQLSTDGSVTGFAILRYQPSGQEAVVPLENRHAGGYLLAYDNTGGTATGVALNVVSAEAIKIPVVLRDETGAQVGSGSVPLAANGHSSFILATQFPQTFDRRGTVEFDAPPGVQIGVVGIRTPMTHTFTTLPALVK